MRMRFGLRNGRRNSGRWWPEKIRVNIRIRPLFIYSSRIISPPGSGWVSIANIESVGHD